MRRFLEGFGEIEESGVCFSISSFSISLDQPDLAGSPFAVSMLCVRYDVVQVKVTSDLSSRDVFQQFAADGSE